MKILTMAPLVALLVGCGAYQQRSTGIAEETLLIIRGESLIGLTVSIDPEFRQVIRKSDLTAYQMGILGASDKEEERLQTVTLKVDSGERQITISDGDQLLVSRAMQFSAGQTRELRIRQ